MNEFSPSVSAAMGQHDPILPRHPFLDERRQAYPFGTHFIRHLLEGRRGLRELSENGAVQVVAQTNPDDGGYLSIERIDVRLLSSIVKLMRRGPDLHGHPNAGANHEEDGCGYQSAAPNKRALSLGPP